MSVNEENNSPTLQSPVAKKLRKQWKFDPSIPIPKSTFYRQLRNSRLLEDTDNSSSEESLIADDRVESYENDRENVDNSEVSELENESSSLLFQNNSQSSGDGSSSILHEVTSESSECDDDSSSLSHENTSESSNLSDDRDDLAENDFLINNDTEEDHNDEFNTDHFRTMTDFVTMLYDGTHTSLSRAVLLVIDFYVTCKLSKFALQMQLNMLQEMLPQPNKMPKTVYHLFKFVEDAATSFRIIKHYYCKTCSYYNGDEAPVVPCTSCSSTDGFSYFYEIDIIDVIKYMFEERKLWSKLRTSNEQEGAISDITNGSEYHRVTSRKEEYDLTLIMNTDGLSLVKSSKSHCWPLMCMIAELPEYLRESFICVMGLWYDTNQKPSMNTFLQPFCKKLVQCFHEGITWVHPVTKRKCISRIVCPLFIADAPARAELQNIMYFNGRYGCNICEIKTQRCTMVEGKRRTRAYIFRATPSCLRNGDRMERQALEVVNNNLKHKKGVKGLSVISALPLLDLGTCVLPEYMHSVLLGVGNQFFNLWINEKGDWNIKQLVPEIDKILLDIRPPYFFNRMPRSLTLLQYFKASEFYNLLLFYSLPILVNYLPDVYLQHWMLLVAAIYNLLKRSISELDLQQSEILLKLFVRDIQGLYDDRQYTYNVHQLLHLVLCIRRWGPLWSTSAFPFENMNGILASCVHGSKHLGQEMVKNLKIAQGLQCLKIMHQESRNSSNYLNERSFEILDKKEISPEDVDLLEYIQSLDLIIDDIKFYSRAKINSKIFTSKHYKTTKTNSFTIKVDIANKLIHGEIEIFLEIDNEQYMIVKPFIIDHTKVFGHRETDTIIQHILPVTEGNEFMYLKWNDIKTITHMIRTTNYICEPPNTLNKIM